MELLPCNPVVEAGCTRAIGLACPSKPLLVLKPGVLLCLDPSKLGGGPMLLDTEAGLISD